MSENYDHHFNPFRKLPWASTAACRSLPSEIFFPERGQPTEPAKAVCATCDHVIECHEYAMNFPKAQGIWGGRSERERRRIRRTMAQARANDLEVA